MLGRWKQLSRKEISRNNWWGYFFDQVEYSNGKKGEYHVIDIKGASVIVPILDNGKILCVNTYRYVHDKKFIELPMGGIGDDSYKDAARRELIEETGFDGDCEFVGEFYPSNAMMTEKAEAFIARNLVTSNEFSQDDTEEFEYLEYTPQELDNLIESGKITDGFTISA